MGKDHVFPGMTTRWRSSLMALQVTSSKHRATSFLVSPQCPLALLAWVSLVSELCHLCVLMPAMLTCLFFHLAFPPVKATRILCDLGLMTFAKTLFSDKGEHESGEDKS